MLKSNTSCQIVLKTGMKRRYARLGDILSYLGSMDDKSSL